MPNTIATAVLLSLTASAQTLTGSVTQTLPDFFRFTLTVPTSVNFRINGISGANVDAGIVDSSGFQIRDLESRNPNFMAENLNAILQPGTYYLKIFTGSSSAANYTLTYYASTSASNDILWRSSGADILYWKWNGANVYGVGTLPQLSDPSWRIRATGDFNSDGKNEVVWQNVNSFQIVIWYCSNNGIIAADLLNTVPVGFTVRGAGDFNGDGNTDLVLSDANGTVQIWYFDGKRRLDPIATEVCSNSGGNWTLGAVGDFNGDGKADLVWREPGGAGNLTIWYMDGARVIGGTVIGGVTDQSWQLAGSGDFNNDGKPDLLWRRSTDGQLLAFIMNGPTFASSTVIATSSDTTWVPTAGYRRVFEAKVGGTTTANATPLGAINSASDYGQYRGNVGGQNPADVFSFTVASAQTVRLSIDSTTANRVQLELLNSGGTVIATTNNNTSLDGLLNAPEIVQSLAVGSYFLRVSCLDAQDNVYYTMNLNKGWTQYNDFQTGALSQSLSLTGQSVGSSANAFYRLDLSSQGILTVALSGLSNDAELRIAQDRDLNGSLETVNAFKFERGVTGETVRAFLEPGQYFVWVSNAGTGYTTTFNIAATFTPASIDSVKQYFKLNFDPTMINIATSFKNPIIQQASWFESTIQTNTAISVNFLPITISSESLPAGTLALAGPTTFDVSLTDRSDIRILRANARFDFGKTSLTGNAYTFSRVVRHELFHCFGFGTLWQPQATPSGPAGFNFVDTSTSTFKTQSYSSLSYGLLLNQLTASPVPLETPLLDHWRESTFGNELMTPISASPGTLMPTSQLSLNSLRDLRWDVNLGAADFYSL